MTWAKTLLVGCIPFLFGDCLKAIAAAIIAIKLKDMISMEEVVAS